MHETLSSIAYILSIIMSSSAIANYILIRPLSKAIKDLKDSIDEVKVSIKELTESNRALEIRSTTIEAMNNEHDRRIARLEKKVFGE